MKEKYVDEKWPQLIEFGREVNGSRVGICTADSRVDVLVDKPVADELVEHWNAMQSELVAMALAFNEANPEAFKKFWYR